MPEKSKNLLKCRLAAFKSPYRSKGFVQANFYFSGDNAAE